jgi:hypothetical protein
MCDREDDSHEDGPIVLCPKHEAMLRPLRWDTLASMVVDLLEGRAEAVASLTARLQVTNDTLGALLVASDDLTAQNEKLRAEVDNAYTERNLLVAHLFRGFPLGIAWWADAPDAEGFVIVYLETDEGQLSWHMKAEEAQEIMPDWLDHTAKNAGKWDGHTTGEKYTRLAALEGRPNGQ